MAATAAARHPREVSIYTESRHDRIHKYVHSLALLVHSYQLSTRKHCCIVPCSVISYEQCFFLSFSRFQIAPNSFSRLQVRKFSGARRRKKKLSLSRWYRNGKSVTRRDTLSRVRVSLWKTENFPRVSFPEKKNVLEKFNDSVGTIASSHLDRSPYRSIRGKKAREIGEGEMEEGEQARGAMDEEPTASGHDPEGGGQRDNKISESAGRCRNSGYVTGTTPLHSTAEGRVPSRRGV